MAEDIFALEKRLKHVEETASKSEIEKKLFEELKDYDGDDRVIPFKDVKERERRGCVSSGISRLDFLIEGFHAGDLIVVTGPTGQGKTTLLQTFTVNISKQKIKSLWFSYEVSVPNLIKNFGSDVPDGYVPRMLRETSIIWIERRIVDGIVNHGVQAVFVDPFNSLTKFSSNKLSQELGDLAEKLKQIAIKYNLAVFVTAHARRMHEDEIMTEDIIRDTALLGSKADFIMTIWRKRLRQTKHELQENGIIYKDESTLSVVKNRLSGKVGFTKIIHNGTKFLQLDSSVQKK